MENQIIRIPYKYWELLNTMSDSEAGKLIKGLFAKDQQDLIGLTDTYYNIIILDIENLENQVKQWKEGGKKGGRPKKTTLGDIKIKTPPLEIVKPKVKESNISKDKIKEDKVKEKDLSKDNTTEVVKVDNRVFEIDLIIETLKKCNKWILDDTIKKQRQY